jgi:hypothetical protein
MRKIIFLSALLFIIASPVLAEECPFGVENDPAPGQCRLYTDKNGNNYCDYGEPSKPVVTSKPVASVQPSAPEKSGDDFYLLPLTIAFFVLQAALIILLRLKKIGLPLLKKINNWLLLLFFVVIIISSVPFLLRAAGLATPSGLKTWSLLHTDSGWLMILFSIEHIIRRWWFFKIKGRTAVQ